MNYPLSAIWAAVNCNLGSVRDIFSTKLLKDNTLVAGTPSQPLTIEVFEQGDGVFARAAGQFLECRDADAFAFCLFIGFEQCGQTLECAAVKNEFRADAHEHFITQQNLQDFL